MASKLRIRIADVEIDYEGTEEFLKQELPALLKTAMELHKASGAPAAGGERKKAASTGDEASREVPSLTTGSIAAKLSAKSGGDLLRAAAAHLALVTKNEPFSRQKLLDQMKSASNYFRKTYSANLSSYLKTALQKDGFLSEIGTDAYALTASARSELESKLANP